MSEQAEAHPATDALLREALIRIVDKRTTMDDGFWISQREMRYAEMALAATPPASAERDAVVEGLSPTQALGVALSTGPMHDKVMSECQVAAIPMMDHLEAMGFTLRAAEARDVDRGWSPRSRSTS